MDRVGSSARRGAGTLRSDDVGTAVCLRGWLHRRRDLGGLLFLQLRDRSGIVQAVVHPEEQAALYAELEPLRPEWVLEIEGTIKARTAKDVNPEMATGEVEVAVARVAVLAESETPPVGMEQHTGVNEDTRLRYRYLDLRRPALQRNFLLRDRLTFEIRSYLHERGFLELDTPILTRSTPEGARDFLVPSRVQRGSFFALPQSPQLFKQLLMVSGFERYYQIARCFRDEDLRADRQPEFTQVDIELSFTDEETVMALIEGMFARVFPLAGIEPPAAFPRLRWADAMARFGSDRPDLRFGMEIVDLSSRLGATGFRGFQTAVAEGGAVRGFTVPGAAAASRKQVDGWSRLAQQHGAVGVLTLRRRDGELAFQVKTALTDGECAGAAADLALGDGDLALIVAGDTATTAQALGALRLQLAREYRQIPEGTHAFLWVYDFPLFGWNADQARWDALHHPFTSPAAEDVATLEQDPGAARSRAYDVVLNGLELGGGSIRIHDRALQERVLALLGMDAEEAASRFGFLLEALRYGAPPHGGIALGLDRLAMVLAGASSIRDVIPFPKTASATCLLTAAPSPVDRAQLDELGLALRAPAPNGDHGGDG